MEKKKITIIFVLCVALLTGTFYVVKQVFNSKKTLNVSVNELVEKKSNSIMATQESEVIEQEEGTAIIENNESVISNRSSVIAPQEEKKVIEDQKTNTENKNSSNDSVGKIVQKSISWGFTKSSDRKIDTVIVHTSYNSLGGDEYDADKIIDIYKQYNVSAHYLILRNGTIYQLVSDQNISWHAGVSEMPDGRKNVNDFSIGIEVINTKDGKFTDDQYAALNRLIGDLRKKYPVKYVLGHDDIAPDRKTDPWGIDWGKVKK